MGADRLEPDEAVEVEAPERAGVVAHPEIPLRDGGLGQERDQQHRRSQRRHQPRGPRIEPDERAGDDDDLDGRAPDVRDQRRQRAQAVQEVRAFSHVGHGAALEVPIGEARDLVEEQAPEPLFEAGSRPAEAVAERGSSASVAPRGQHPRTSGGDRRRR
jgi:hypothetical protein